MSLTGTTIGHYEILDLLGVGGMGEVYRGRDKTLDRIVAIKVLPEEWADDGDRLARLQREAKVLAQLEHPNIAAIHGLEEATSASGVAQRLLIMQLAEGENLQEWIGTPALSMERALDIGLQIASGLEAAHERGVVHRDLKPANIKVSEDAGGHPHVKLLDFGLAKAYEPDGSASDISPESSASPTVVAATRTGVILGTAAYMSPEQARGKVVDKRADIWAFGVVMFEMLSGRRLFGGETVSDMLAAVLKTDPDWHHIPPDTPPRVVRLLRRCLEKDPIQRLRDIGEARVLLENPGGAAEPAADASLVADAAPTEDAAAPRVAGAAASPGLTRLVPWAIAAAAIAVAAWAWTSRAPAVSGSYELAVGGPVDSEFLIGTNSGNAIISPDGTKLAFVATTDQRPLLWVRPLDADEPVPLPGTDGPQYPFWSADSTQLAFFSQGSLKKVDISGGLPETLAPAANGRGGSWGADGTILFTPQGAGTVHKVADTGGEVENLTTHDAGRGENAHYWPHILPDGERFLFFARGNAPENSGVYLAHVDGSSPPVRLVASMSSGVYAPPYNGHPGHLLWVRDGTLLAQPLDLDAAELTGAAAVIATGVRVEESQRGLLTSVSDDGVLAWATARAADNVARWYDRQGLVTGGLEIEPGAIQQVALSRDSTKLLFAEPVQGTSDIWLHDVDSGTTRAVAAGPGFEELPVWSRDEEWFFYTDTGSRLMMADPDGVEEERVLYELAVNAAGQPSPDGRHLAFVMEHPEGGRAPAAMLIDNPGDPVPLTEGAVPPNSMWGFSPDGQWLLLASWRTGDAELYAARWIVDGDDVRLGDPWTPISNDGFGFSAARWTDSGEIIYLAADNNVVAVPVTQVDDGLELGRERRLFEIQLTSFGSMDIAADGQSFVITTAPYAERQTIRVLTNWHSRLPGGR